MYQFEIEPSKIYHISFFKCLHCLSTLMAMKPNILCFNSLFTTQSCTLCLVVFQFSIWSNYFFLQILQVPLRLIHTYVWWEGSIWKFIFHTEMEAWVFLQYEIPFCIEMFGSFMWYASIKRSFSTWESIWTCFSQSVTSLHSCSLL